MESIPVHKALGKKDVKTWKIKYNKVYLVYGHRYELSCLPLHFLQSFYFSCDGSLNCPERYVIYIFNKMRGNDILARRRNENDSSN